MTPIEFHEACHSALYQCPQFQGYDDDMHFDGVGCFADIPKMGWVTLVKFWKGNSLLWKSGYSKALPADVLELFETVDQLFEQAISNATK